MRLDSVMAQKVSRTMLTFVSVRNPGDCPYKFDRVLLLVWACALFQSRLHMPHGHISSFKGRAAQWAFVSQNELFVEATHFVKVELMQSHLLPCADESARRLVLAE